VLEHTSGDQVVFALVLFGLFTERRCSEEALKQSKDRRQQALDWLTLVYSGRISSPGNSSATPEPP
jgi:hypothetical protein